VSDNDMTIPRGLVRELRVNPTGDVAALKFAGIEGWYRVFVREGEVLCQPADDVSPFEWPMVGTTDPNLIRSLPATALPGAVEPDMRSYTFTPTREPQLVFFESAGASVVDHGDGQGPAEHMSDRSLYILDALLRMASRRVTREIQQREAASE
jgi:hypothetical protein